MGDAIFKVPTPLMLDTFVKMMETLGFDIELHYVKREEANEAAQR